MTHGCGDGERRFRTGRQGKKLAHVVVLACVAWASPGLATSAEERDPRKIAQAVEDRDTGHRAVSQVRMTIRDALGRVRERRFTQRRLEFKEGAKTLMTFQEPADMRGTGILSIDYDDGDRDDDQWLFLPSLGKSTRLEAANSSDAFLGTDLTYADITAIDTSKYDYTMVRQHEVVDGEPCWVVEARPRTKKERERTGYLKTRAWISKAKMMPVRTKAWVEEGRKLKYLQLADIRKVAGVLTAHKVVVRTVNSGALESETTMVIEQIQYEQPAVVDTLFTTRQLEAGI